MSSYIIPFLVIFILLYGVIKNVDIYNEFLDGVLEGVKLCFKIFPVMFSMMICINVLLKSNIINDVSNKFSFILNFFNYPNELVPLAVMRPISGSSSLIIMNNIFKKCGVDSFVGKVASVLQGSTDTTIYIISLYFSSVGIKKIKYSLFVGLLADFFSVVISYLVIKFIF